MNPHINDTLEIPEIQRLTELLPTELRSKVTILAALEIEPDFVVTQRVNVNLQNYRIKIDFNRWQSLNINQRNLLFWHEVACIQGQGIRKSSGELVVMGIGATALLTELMAQNLVGAVTTLAVTSLAGYQLYQQHCGEHSLKASCTADRDALELGMQFGYSFLEASNSLCCALQTLIKWKSQKSHKKRYQVRLSVLEILSAQEVPIPAVRVAFL